VNTRSIFISHASKDDGFVKELREALEGQGLAVWVDSRNLCGGAKLAPEIQKSHRRSAASHRRAESQHHQLALGAQRDPKALAYRPSATANGYTAVGRRVAAQANQDAVELQLLLWRSWYRD
jgi:hypothetical protein